MFVRVDQKQASPNAIGILIPHGVKTLVIVRPRSLTWDLLPARWDQDTNHAPQFSLFTRDEAASVARGLVKSLEAAVTQGSNPVQTFGAAQGERRQIWVRTELFVWIACRRAPGEAYQPMLFASSEDAIREGEKLAEVIWPAIDKRQEYYFNTQNLA